jgi:chromosome segregation ATPase
VGRLTIKKKDLENEVEVRSNAIRKRDEEIAQKEREVREAIKESDRLRLEIDTLQAMGKNKEIEKLEEELAEQENTIMNLRKNKTMTREEIEEEFGNITKVQERKLDDLKAMMKEQAEQAKQDNDEMKDTLKMMFSLMKKN